MTTKSDKSKTGFIIKLSSETVQKLSVEEEQFRNTNVTSDTNEKTSDANVTSDSIDNSEPLKKCDHLNNIETIPHEVTADTHSRNESKDINDGTKNSVGENNDNSWGEYAPFIIYEGDEAIYTDPNSHQKYKWNKLSNVWDPTDHHNAIPDRVYSYENDTHIYTESDGSKFFWDIDKKAWIPKVDDDFLALYQMSYGFVDNTTPEPSKDKDNKEDKINQTGLKRKNEPQWFEPSQETNTKVYVSNLPLDMSEEEFVNLMQKCGLIERDLGTQKMKVKLYFDKEHNCFKGDALCTYIKIESVDLALKLLDGSDFKGNKINVERAHFQLKGDYNPALKPKKRKKKELEKIKKMQQKLFDWRPEKFVGERSKHEKVVIVKNLFHPSDFDKDVQLILDYQQDMRDECSKVGEVRKVIIYDRHPEGVAQITMKEFEQADAVIQLINGRWFGKRQILAEIWDGKTKYKIAETDAEITKRVDNWDKFLEGKDDKVEDKVTESISNKEKLDHKNTV